MPETLPQVRLTTLELRLRALETVSLPRYPGATFRGGLGQALRGLACVTGAPTCDGCPHHSRCAYGVIWEPTLPAGEGPKRFRNPPRPYVLEPMLYGAERTFFPGDKLSLRLKLFGTARDHVPDFILAMRAAARRGFGRGRSQLELVKVTSVAQSGQCLTLFDESGFHRWTPLQEVVVAPANGTLRKPSERVRLVLETPLQLTSKGRAAARVNPETLTARLAERLDLLSLVHEGWASDWDFQRVRRLSRQAWVVHEDLLPVQFERYSSRRKARIPMGGLLGAILFENVPPDVVALWRTGEHIHVGKQATFGFGKVRVERLEASLGPGNVTSDR